MRIDYLRSARDDLDGVYDYVAGDDPDAADRLIAAIRKAVAKLADYPRRAPEWSPGVRKLSTSGFAIMYRIVGDRIEIGRVLHLRRDLDELDIGFRPDDA